MSLLRLDQIEALIEYVTARAPDLLAACRWLLVDPRLTALILGRDARPPSAADLARFLRLVRDAPPEAAAAAQAPLVARRRREGAA